MQKAIENLLSMHGFTATDDSSVEQVETAEKLIEQINTPLSDEEAVALVEFLPETDDTLYGLNWVILHAIETAPSWPIWSSLKNNNKYWVHHLRTRLINGGYIPPEHVE